MIFQKKVLFFMSTTAMGGAETNVIKIAQELLKRGIEVHLATLENNGIMHQASANTFKSFTVVGLFHKNPLISFWRYYNLLKKEQFNVVFNFGIRVEFFSRLICGVFSPQTNIISNIRSTDRWRKWYHVELDKLTFKYVTKWVSNSQAGKEAFVIREGIKPEQIDVIYNFFSGKIAPTKNNPNTVLKAPVIGVLANIKPLKGHLDLIPLCKALLAQGITPRFKIAGADLMNGTFQQKVNQATLAPYFDFMGMITNKGDFFNEIDLFLLPSYLEGMPTVVLEAMQHNCPIVATHIDGIPEQITHGFNGYLYTPGNITDLTNCILKLCTETELRSQFVSNAHQVLSQKFHTDVSMQKWLNLIKN